jgi:hypothetical protein
MAAARSRRSLTLAAVGHETQIRVVTSGVLVSLGLVAGCGGRGIPRTQANLAVNAPLAKAYGGS